MPTERFFHCGGTKPHQSHSAERITHLNIYGKNPNVFFNLNEFSKRLAADIPDLYCDLLEITAYIYSGDQVVPRGGPTSPKVGEKWQRKLHYFIPVRKPDFWGSSEVKTALEDTLSFLSEDVLNFEFSPFSQPRTVFHDEAFSQEETIGPKPDEVILFSGGLDSLAGAIEECVGQGKKVALVTHRSTPKTGEDLKNLVSSLRKICGSDAIKFLPVWVNKAKSLGREHTQRTRSFLYSALAATVAGVFGIPRIKFYENGVTGINLPISDQLVGARASRTTHPQSLKLIAHFLNFLFQRQFTIENPFIWKTKTDIINLIGDAGCAHLVKLTRSCTRTIERVKEHPHCGKCSQCIDRRFAALASKYAKADPEEHYKVDLLTGGRENGEQVTVVDAYIRMSRELRTMSDFAFLTRFGEVSRVVNALGGNYDKAAQNVYELHTRHGKQLASVLTDGFRKYTDQIFDNTLPNNCCIMMAMPKDYPKTLVDEIETTNEPTFVRYGKVWFIWFKGFKTTVDDSIGMAYIGYLLSYPKREIYILTLYSAVNKKMFNISHEEVSTDAAIQSGLNAKPIDQSDDIIDVDTLAACKERIDELEDKIRDAKSIGNDALSDKFKNERNNLIRFVKATTNKDGKPRKSSNSEIQKKISSVYMAIQRAIDDIQKEHEEFATHLRHSISAKSYCEYTPESEIDWITE